MLKSSFRRFIAALGLGALFAAAPAAALAPAHPALWAVSDADTTIYLFGTIHLLPDDLQWRTAKFDVVVDESGRSVQRPVQVVYAAAVDGGVLVDAWRALTEQ